jgi:hypothetical protein
MGLREWLKTRGYSPDKGLCVTVGTDGLRVDKDHILSVSTSFPFQPPHTVYIDGADCSKVQHITGVDCMAYDADKVGVERAIELIADDVNEAEFIITYRCENFTKPWLQEWMPELFSRVEFLDVVEYIHAYDLRLGLPNDMDKVEQLRQYIQSALVGRDLYTFKSVCNREGITEAGGTPSLESKPVTLGMLYNKALMRE